VLDGFFAGDEAATVVGLPVRGLRTSFSLPGMAVLVSGSVRQRYFNKLATLDTLLLWSDLPAITLVWRHVIHPRQKISEVGSVTVSLMRLRTARELYE
jgi:hypothetical protein